MQINYTETPPRLGKTGYIPRPVAERFWPRVDRSMPEGCWLWTGGRFTNGYGKLWVGSKTDGSARHQAAHRVSWVLHYGYIPDGLWVLHKCDVPLCVRPEHLRLGTPRENSRDCARKQRNGSQKHPEQLARGESHGKAKLNDVDVRAIRLLAQSGSSSGVLAVQFRISRSTIQAIVNGRAWKHVE